MCLPSKFHISEQHPPPPPQQEAAGSFLLQALGLRPQCSPRAHSSAVKERLDLRTGSRWRRPQTLTFAPSSYIDGGTGLWPPDQRSWKGSCQAKAPLGGGPSHSQPGTKAESASAFPKLLGTSEAFSLLLTHFPPLGYTLSEWERTMSVCVYFRVPACCCPLCNRLSGRQNLTSWCLGSLLLGLMCLSSPPPTYKSQKSPPGPRDSSC